MSVQFRIASLDDIESLIEMRILMQSEVNQIDEIDEHNLIAYRQKCHQYFYEFINNKNYQCIVALKNEYIIGTAGVCFYHKPPSLVGESTGLVGYVTNVYTDKKYRDQGIGTKMMDEVKKIAINRKADKLHLGATEDGASIYRAVGFVEPRFLTLELKTS
jgi:ribosomal protein S18 acetylase RimI-like enzyme